MADHFIAWWNLENLFDTEDYPDRTDKLARTLAKEITGWNQPILDKKLDQLARVIGQMNGGNGPDIIGVCEVENRHVLELLAAKITCRPYSIVHADTKDERGIDVAFLYDGGRYETKPEEIFFHVVLRRNATRDIVQVNFTVKASARKLVLIGNHWPSRMEGETDSEPYRMAAAETLGYYHERIRELHGNDAAVAAMGDFNDEPFNRSVQDYARGWNNQEKVKNAKEGCFYNLMWPLLAEGVGTFYLSGPNVLDHFMVSRGIVTGDSGFSIVPGSIRREIYPGMADGGDYKKPVKFGRPSATLNQNGFSDHFPISVKLAEA